MARPQALDPDEIESRLEALPGWHLEGGKLHRSFRFGNFVEAFGFMTQAALHAERLDHHPEWSNAYDRVEVALVPHEVPGTNGPAITPLDFELATHMNRIAPPSELTHPPTPKVASKRSLPDPRHPDARGRRGAVGVK